MQGYGATNGYDSSDRDDAIGGIAAAVPRSVTSGGGGSSKKKIIRRNKTTDAGASSHADPTLDIHENLADRAMGAPNGLQVVSSQQEADALVRRLKQLETENASLANTLAKVCDENANLTGVVSQLEGKVTELAHEPLKKTSVLHSLFEPEKTGWFGGSKSAAREQLEKLSEALQNEFMEYKAAHASSNDEMQAMMVAMQAANTNAAEVSRLVKEQQLQMTQGPLAITVRVVPVVDGDAGDGGITLNELRDDIDRQRARNADLQDQLKRTNEELRTKAVEVAQLRGELRDVGPSSAAAGAGSAATLKMEIELQKAKDENAKLRDELQQLRQALAAEERLHSIKKAESEELARKLEEQRGAHRGEVTDLRKQLAESLESSLAGCPRCEDMRAELRAARQQAEAATKDAQDAKAQLAQVSAKNDTSSAALQAKLLEAQTSISTLEAQLKRSVPEPQHASLELERNTLSHELELAKERIATLEELNASKSRAATSGGVESSPSFSETVVLDTLEKNKDRIARLEFERDQVKEQLQKAQAYAVTRDQEAQRLERAALEDKQRVAFLLKKCAAVTADLRTVTAARDALSEDLDKAKMDAKQLQRRVENLSSVQQRNDELVKERAQMEARLSSAEELEEKLVKAKETIAYMELAQSRTINMSQYAELQAAKDKLENTMGPLKKKLEDANKEIERLRSVTDAQQLVTGSQLNSVQNMQDQLSAATASETKLRDKVAALQTENDRLAKVNASLEANMTDMQDGIKEMAMQMEKERTGATAKAEAQSQKQVEELRAQLAKAQAELATVQATTGQFVAEGLYQNVCSERDRLADENKKKGFEFEKQKSEILIYRQTIADLEAENDEHVKEIESLQDRYQSERTSLSERLTTEQRKSAELAALVDSLKEELKARDAKLDQGALSVKDLQELLAKQKRAFEEKCRQEEKLTTQLETLQANNVTLQSTYEQKLAEARAASPPSAMVSAAGAASQPATVKAALDMDAAAGKDGRGSSVSPAPDLAELQNRLYKVQCENDRMHGELKRLHIKHKAESDEDQRMIQLLQVQVKSRMPADLRTTYEAEISKSTALRNSNEALLKENESLKRQVAAAPTVGLLTAGAPTSVLPSNAADLQAQLNQLQQQMAMQKSGYDAAMTQAIADAQAKQQRIEALEAELRDLHDNDPSASHAQTKNNSFGEDAAAAGGAGASTGAGEDVTADGTTPRPKKKIKKIKKKKSLAEQVAAVDPTADILAPHAGDGSLATGTAAAGAASLDNGKDLQLQLQLSQADLLKAQKELEVLRSENKTLKEHIAQLTEDLQNCQDDLDQANAAMDEERADFEKRIHALERQVKTLSDQPPLLSARTNSLSVSGQDSPANRSFSRVANAQETEMQLRSARDENEKLRMENRQLKNDLAKATSNTSPSAPGLGASANAGGAALTAQEAKKLRKLLRQKDAEIQSLADQLMPIKDKLAEYMAMADRLGLQYPFPPQLEGATMLRLRAMNIQAANRATSAPMPTSAAGKGPQAADASPAPRPPPGARRGAAGGGRRAGGGGQAASDRFAEAKGLDDLR